MRHSSNAETRAGARSRWVRIATYGFGSLVGGRIAVRQIHRAPAPQEATIRVICGLVPRRLCDELALHTAWSAVSKEVLNLEKRCPIDIIGDGVFQAGCGNREIQSALVGHAGAESIDQSGAEGVTCSYTLDDARNVVAGACQQRFAIVQTGRPTVLAGVLALPERNSLDLQIRVCEKHLPGDSFNAAVRVTGSSLFLIGEADAKGERAIFFVSKEHINMLD